MVEGKSYKSTVSKEHEMAREKYLKAISVAEQLLTKATKEEDRDIFNRALEWLHNNMSRYEDAGILSKKKKLKQLDFLCSIVLDPSFSKGSQGIGNMLKEDPKHLANYFIVSGRRFGKSTSQDHTDLRLDYTETLNQLTALPDSDAKRAAIRELKDTAVKYEDAPNTKSRDKAYKSFYDAYETAHDMISVNENVAKPIAPEVSVSSKVASPTQTSVKLTIDEAAQRIVTNLSETYGPPKNENHKRVRDGFSDRLLKLESSFSDSKDASLVKLRSEMLNAMREFEKKFSEAHNKGDKSIAEPAANTLKGVYVKVTDMIMEKTASKAPSVEENTEQSTHMHRPR